jgi:hypothetical protein
MKIAHIAHLPAMNLAIAYAAFGPRAMKTVWAWIVAQMTDVKCATQRANPARKGSCPEAKQHLNSQSTPSGWKVDRIRYFRITIY